MVSGRILVQSQAGQVSRGPLETGIPFELLFEVDAVLQRVGTGKRVDADELFHGESPIP